MIVGYRAATKLQHFRDTTVNYAVWLLGFIPYSLSDPGMKYY
jgi:hypothetical protein